MVNITIFHYPYFEGEREWKHGEVKSHIGLPDKLQVAQLNLNFR